MAACSCPNSALGCRLPPGSHWSFLEEESCTTCCLAGHIPAYQNVFLLASQCEAAPDWAVGVFGHLGGFCPCSTQVVLVSIHNVGVLVADHCCPQVLEKTKQVIESHPNQPWVIMEMENGASAKVWERLNSPQQPSFCLSSSWVVSHHLERWFSATELSLLPPADPEKGEGPLGYSLVSHLLD